MVVKLNYPNIEAERARLGLSKVELSRSIGVALKTYYNWINGDNPIPSDVLIRMSEMFGTNIDYLLGISENRKRDAV